MDSTRRRMLGAIAGSLSVVAAGCLGGDDAGDAPDGVPQRIHEYVHTTQGYEESIPDRTGQSELRVAVGAGTGGLAFDPVVARIDAGTTVVWEWTGRGSTHNVVSDDGSDFSFESARHAEAGTTFEQPFDEPGIALYVCTPHRAQSMFGALDVV
ncbi:halocyanin [Natronomonas pharaonis DSM 2160]|uniref:Halocyanin n=1 Tax=Natronomonas pharaonis (strain ATCC 35678 / DSM 2160 / CIP 103997 / JCM 8858 / NBRC 14720 / NCIMB 2260 / Gabara) TaxID=348780 RepID=A0A1U7EUD4_NATPD|nr:halocyanin domain-containing protein [Natronomonas pharaonis]CAI48560.1 halocyanin [Natronomonas pharaonis DSM 2160]